MAVALGLPAFGHAATILTSNTTQNGGTLTVSPADELVVSGPANPLLTFTNAAVTSGVEGVIVGTTQSPYGSSGQLRVEDGSTLSNTGTETNTGTYGDVDVFSGVGYLGLNSGSTGTATVTGTGSTWTNSQSLYVGDYGSGTLKVEDGGSVSNTFGYLGLESGSAGTATVTGGGSTWTSSQYLYVGDSGTGTLNVADGGSVSDSYGIIGSDSGSTGTATVTGGGSTWTTSQNLVVGEYGAGALNIKDGGSVVSSRHSIIGSRTGSTGTVTVTGIGADGSSTWTTSQYLFVGLSGTGTLNVESGGSVLDIYGDIAALSGSTGTVTVTGSGSTWTNSENLVVGDTGAGTLNVQDGASVSATFGHVGLYSGSTGTATVTGSGSTWTNSSILYVGDSGAGTLKIENGGSVSNTSGRLGINSGVTGTATVTGSGSTWINSRSLYVGGLGTGTLSISDGGTVEVGETTDVGNATSQINLKDGGTLKTQSLTLGGVTSRLNWTGGTLQLTGGSTDTGLSIPAGGTLVGTGTIGGNLASAGTISPGNSPGALAVSGDLSSSGTFLMQIASDLSYDQVNATGAANFTGATIGLSLLSFTPSDGQSFDLFDFTGSLGGTWSFDFTNAPLPAGLAWQTDAFAATGSISVAAVPEPASLALLALAGLTLLSPRRRLDPKEPRTK